MKRDFKHITLVDMKAKPALVRLNRPSFYSDYKLVPPFREQIVIYYCIVMEHLQKRCFFYAQHFGEQVNIGLLRPSAKRFTQKVMRVQFPCSPQDSVAQLERAFAYEAKGFRFES